MLNRLTGARSKLPDRAKRLRFRAVPVFGQYDVVFFVIKLKTRTVEIAGITCQLDEAWMMQVARNLTAAGFLRGIQYVILDRDPLYTTDFGACCATVA